MAIQRLPVPGQDEGSWGDILNGFLEVAHNSDGTLNSMQVSAAGAEMTVNKGQANGYASLNGSGLVPSTQMGGGSPSSSNFLRGDGIWAVPSGGGSSALAADTDVSIVSPQNKQVLTYNSADSKWENSTALVTSVAGQTGNVTLSESDITNLTTDLSSRIQVGGDLSGTPTNPSVAKVNGVTISNSPTTSSQILLSTSTTAAAWANFSAMPNFTEVSVNYLASPYNPTNNTATWMHCDTTSGVVDIHQPSSPAAGYPLRISNETGTNNAVFTPTGLTIAPGQTATVSYDGINGKWVEVTATPSVISAFGRTGAIVATSGDYTASQVTNAADTSSLSSQVFSGKLETPGLGAGIAPLAASGSIVTPYSTLDDGSGNAIIGGNLEVAGTSGYMYGYTWHVVSDTTVAGGSSYTISTGDARLCNASAGAATYSLPAAAAGVRARVVRLGSDTSANSLTINAPTSKVIYGPGLGSSGQSSIVLNAPGAYIELAGDVNGNYSIIGGAADSGWMSLSPYYVSPWLDGSVPGQIRKIGNVVRFQGSIQGGTNGSQFLTLEYAFYPNSNTVFIIGNANGGVGWSQITVLSNGSGYVYSGTTTAGNPAESYLNALSYYLD